MAAGIKAKQPADGPLTLSPADDPSACIPINGSVPHTIETEAFKGRMLLWVAGLPSSPPGLFAGQKRRSHLVIQVLSLQHASSASFLSHSCTMVSVCSTTTPAAVLMQGEFKRRVGLDEAWTGQHFQRALLNLPPAWLLHYVFALAQRLAPSMRIGDPGAPYVLSPLISAAQVRAYIGCRLTRKLDCVSPLISAAQVHVCMSCVPISRLVVHDCAHTAVPGASVGLGSLSAAAEHAVVGWWSMWRSGATSLR